MKRFFVLCLFFASSVCCGQNNGDVSCEKQRQNVQLDLVSLNFDFCQSKILVSRNSGAGVIYLKVAVKESGNVIAQKLLTFEKTYAVTAMFSHGQTLVVESRYSDAKSKIVSGILKLLAKLDPNKISQTDVEKVKWTKTVQEEVSLK